MDYYLQFKDEVEKEVGTFARSVETLSKEISAAEKRLADERSKSERIKEQIKKLKDLSGESLTGDVNAFEKFKTSLKNRSNELDASVEVIRLLSEEIIPHKARELSDCERNLKIKLNAYLLQSRRIADERINALLRDCINERQDFLDAFSKIYSDYGLVFVVSDESFCPGIWAGDEIRDLRIRLGMDTQPTDIADNTPDRPQDERTPPETACDTPNSKSEAQTLLTGKL